MNYFSGFCFKNEQELFKEWIYRGDFCVAGFSYGAIKAFEFASTCRDRVDKLQLFSPAFFQDRSDKFRRLQQIYFEKDSQKYIENFLQNVKYPKDIDISKYIKKGTIDELNELLNYKWEEEKIKKLTKKGTNIEIYLGEKDKIINSSGVLDFFKPYADIYYIKRAGHLLTDLTHYKHT